MSEGRIAASTSKLSSSGTISTRSMPGWMTPPTVLILSCLTVPRTGERTSVRATRSSTAASDSLSAERRTRVSLSSAWASRLKVARFSSIRRAVSPSADLARGMASAEASRWRSSSVTWRRRRRISTFEVTPLATMGSRMPSSSRASARLSPSLPTRLFSSTISCLRWSSCRRSTAMADCSSERRARCNAVSLATIIGCESSSAGNVGSAPLTSAARRTVLASRAT